MLTRSQTHLPKPTPRTRTRGAEKPPYGNFSWRNAGSASENSAVSPAPAIDKTVHHYDGSQDISVQPYGHTGRRHDDETGLQYFRARYFDDELGRFVGRDPLQDLSDFDRIMEQQPVQRNAISYYYDGMNLYQAYFVSGGNSVDPSGTLRIKVTQAPKKLTECGSWEYKVQWEWHPPLLPDGWIIQSVVWSADIKDCSGNPVKSKNLTGVADALPKFWEAWQVRGGKVYVGGSAMPHSADTFRTIDEGDCRKGTISITGKVGFAANYNLTKPPWGSLAVAGSLPTIKTDPGVSLDLDHKLEVTFNCCPDKTSAKSSAKGTP
jgi:RHS repeat-associated protein